MYFICELKLEDYFFALLIYYNKIQFNGELTYLICIAFCTLKYKPVFCNDVLTFPCNRTRHLQFMACMY